MWYKAINGVMEKSSRNREGEIGIFKNEKKNILGWENVKKEEKFR